jgi:hypothetical protein
LTAARTSSGYRTGRDETKPLLELVNDGSKNGGTDARALAPTLMVAELVAAGVSRLTAERTVEIQQGEAEPGRARRHTAGKK